jgi:hypothetical protein
MSGTGTRQACQDCGKAFECGIGGREPCWCSADFPAVLPLPKDARGCYCRECLARLVAAAVKSAAT